MADKAGYPVLIAGAGPTGLVTAVDLARRGVPVQIIDAASRPAVGARGKGLQPRSLEVLHDLGVLGPILANGRSRILLRRYQGTEVVGTGELNADAEEPSPSTPYTRTMIISQARVEQILRDRLADLGVAVEYSTALRDYRQDDNQVYAVLDCNGEPRHVTASYLIGCDGASSVVRKVAGIEFLGETDEHTRMLVGDVRLGGLDRDFWHLWPMSGGRLLALCPLPGLDAFQIQLDLPADTSGALSAAEMQAVIDDRSGRRDITIQEVLWQSIWRSNVRMVNRFRAGRVFLAGDAAHVHSPAGGLGMNTGIQDAYNLGWKLAHVLNGAPTSLLESYEQERLPVAAQVLGFSQELIADGIGGVLSAGGQSRDTLQLSVNYRNSSPIAAAAAEGRQCQPGDRAPDSEGRALDGTPTRLFDLFQGPHATVLAFGVRSAQVATRLAERFGPHLRSVIVAEPGSIVAAGSGGSVFVDHAGLTRKAYDIDRDTLVVVRPDGYLVYRTDEQQEAVAGNILKGLFPNRKMEDE